MKDVCRSIAEIPTGVVDEMIKRFVKKCKEKHSIAFMQWRLYFRTEVSKAEELIEIIDDRTEYMKTALKRRKKFIMSQMTVEKAEQTIINEDLYYDASKSEPYHINSFKAIGWPDPWPVPMK